MPMFTMELRKVLEATNDIGLNDYPIFDEAYRVPLNKKIIDHYFMREIGTETIELFRLYLRRKMNEIMPMYNQLYHSQKLIIDPLNTVSLKQVSENISHSSTSGETEMTQASDTTSTGTSSNTSVTDSKARAVSSSTPQTMLSDFGDYADGASDSIGKTDNTGTATDDNTNNTTANGTGTNVTSADSNDTTTNETSGYSGNQSEMLNLFRSTFLNIDMDIITELETLFMGLWMTGDDYFRKEGYGYGYSHSAYGIYPRF